MKLLKIQNSLFKILIELFILNKTKRSKIKSRWAKNNLQKYVNSAVKNLNTTNKTEDCNIIWQYWHQGKENAPILIQKCFDSIQKHEKDKKIEVLCFDTIKNYVNLPQKYYDMVNTGKIPIAIFSDILRMYLLTQYGGCWIDSTIFLSDKIPDDIMNSEFCVLQKNPKTDNQENKMSCFFIRSKSNSKNLNAIKNSLENYWNENDFLINYFMFEHISTMLSEKTLELKSEWDNMPYYSAEDTGILQSIMFNDFNQETWDNIKSKTPIHKLSYKKIKNKISENSYYNYIIEDKLK